MPPVKTLLTESAETSKHVWSLMAKDFYWSRDALRKLGIGVNSPAGGNLPQEVKLQPFEVIVAAVFAQLRPDYNWWVTPNRPDGGVDFIGRGAFLTSKELGIDAAITIGGQCKKRERVNDVVGELSGSFVRMAQTLHPTLFVAALSATLSAKRVAEAKKFLEHTLQRHCHILDRQQLESLIGANLIAAKPIISQAFSRLDAEHIIDYFRSRVDSSSVLMVRVAAPSSVLAGESFHVQIKISRGSISKNSFRLRWNPPAQRQLAGALVAPLGADSCQGVAFDFHIAGGDDPFIIEQDLEFLVYSVGTQPLGSITVQADGIPPEPGIITQLPTVDVVENLRPPFYDVPYREPLFELEQGLARAGSGKVASVAVVGAGGAGKTRLCEEMCLESRRHGAHVVSARQANTTEFPRRILVNLLLGLSNAGPSNQALANRIDDILSRLEPQLASRARPAIEALCGQAGKPGSFEDDQSLLSVLAVLIAQRSRSRTVVIHLHDLHWCTLDVLETIDRLIWQLDHLKVQASSDIPLSGLRVLFLLEGRMHEHRDDAETGWSTRVFERFIGRLACPIARCRAFEPHESAAFAQRLFEHEHSANRQLPRALLDLQEELINAVYRAAGGNPLHLLEQVKLLQQHGVLAQNCQTGLIYMIQPDFCHIPLPPTVFETIEARWRYYWITDRTLAVLLWAAALVDDNLPAALFRHLWSRIAPDLTQPKIESAEFLRLPQRDDEGLQVSFRHENYFQTVRRIQLPEADRRIVVDAYSTWFREATRLSPVMRYVQAKVELEAPSPDFKRVGSLLRAVRGAALRRQDRSLTSRVLATLLDSVTWPSELRRPLSIGSLIQACDDEIILCKNLTRSGRTDIAHERIQHTLGVIGSRLTLYPARTVESLDQLKKRKFTLLTMEAGILYHNRQPAEALVITDDAIKELQCLVEETAISERRKWNSVLMDVRHTHSVAVALVGDMRRAVIEARKAAELAESLLTAFPHALDVIITYANILLCESPKESEQILQHFLSFASHDFIQEETRLRLDLNISMARIVLGYQEERYSGQNRTSCLAVAHDTLLRVFRKAHPLGRLSNAAASALLLGLISALWGKPDEIDWFSEATALAVRARQLETLWRAHINLAHSLFRNGQPPHDPAAAALEIMTYSLNSFPTPDSNPRFDLLAVPMAHAVSYLILARDKKAEMTLRKFPALRRMFTNLESGELKDDRDGRTSHEWLRIGSADYVIY